MREYGQVQSAFWQSRDAQTLTDHGKLLAVYLLTGPHTNGIGCFRVPDGYVMADLGWSAETVEKGFEELSRNGLANRFDGVVFVPNFLRWNRIMNGNIATARFGEFKQLPKGKARIAVARAMLEFCRHWSDEQLRQIETVTQTVTKTVCQPEPNPTQPREEPTKKEKLCPAGAGRFAEFWAVFPRHEDRKRAEAAWRRKRLDASADAIIADVTRRRAEHRAWREGIIPHPTTYLNGERWSDDIDTAQPRHNGAAQHAAEAATSPAASRRLA